MGVILRPARYFAYSAAILFLSALFGAGLPEADLGAGVLGEDTGAGLCEAERRNMVSLDGGWVNEDVMVAADMRLVKVARWSYLLGDAWMLVLESRCKHTPRTFYAKESV